MSIKDYYNKQDFKQKTESDRLFLSMMILMSQTPGFEQLVNNLYGDFDTEYNDLIIAVKTVNDYNEAIKFINQHSTKHSEAIMTNDPKALEAFYNDVDSACLYHNASTRFTDGGEFGFGAEIGISTTKIHARGPMGLKEITTYKYLISGNGQVRK